MATPWTTFQTLQGKMQDYSAAAAEETTGSTTDPRRWMLPPANGWSGDPLDVAGMHVAFDRSQPDADAQAAYSDGGSVGEAMGASMQIAYMGMQERAFRLRHMSPVRAMMHAAGRKMAHGDDAGVHMDVLGYIQRLLDSGAK